MVPASNNLAANNVGVQTFSFLVTDIEGSTKRWNRRPELMRVALAKHDEILALDTDLMVAIVSKAPLFEIARPRVEGESWYSASLADALQSEVAYANKITLAALPVVVKP